MGRMLEALRQIEDRRPVAASVTVVEIAEPEALATAEPVAQPPAPEPRDDVEEPSNNVARPPQAVHDYSGQSSEAAPQGAIWAGSQPLCEAVAPQTTEAPADPVSAEEFVTPPASRVALAEERPEPRYVELAEAIVSCLPPNRATTLFLASLEDDVGSQLRPLYPLLADRMAGGTILVDCDHGCRAFARREPGDADPTPDRILSGEIAWREAVSRSAHPRLDLLLGVDAADAKRSAHPADPRPLVRQLRRAYQLVLLVGSPVNEDEMLAISEASDGTYLVFRLGETPRRRVDRTIRLFQEHARPILGCILLDD
jgi:hypothetical protein